MELTRVTIRNFRCHKESTVIEIGDLTAIVGRNDSGKSSILDLKQACSNPPQS